MARRLLHLGSGGQSTGPAQSTNGSRPILSLESVQEDAHTRNLLFPDAQDLYQHRNDQVFPFFAAPATSSASPANAFDYNDDIELDVKDVRVIIMQDALGPTNASLLYDSHPLPESAASAERHSTATQDLKRAAAPFSPRKASQSQAPRPAGIHTDGSQQLRQGAFDRRASVHGRSPSFGETDGQRAAREYREELATFSSCIFGNSELMAYKGTSTKVHVVPSEPRVTDYGSSVFGDGRSSIGRASGRSSKLSQSYSSQTMSPTHPPPLPTGASTPRHTERKKVLITRLFPVTLAADDLDTITPPSRYSEDNGGFPFPPTSDEAAAAAAAKKKKPQPKQRRTPMYAVVLVVQLPPSTSRMSSAVPPKPSTFREPGSYNDQDMFSSSYSSTRASGWNMSGSGLYGEATDSSFSIDVEDRIDSLTKHWDIVMRTLTQLQSVVSFRLHTMLKQTDMASPGPYSANMSSRRPSVTTDRRLDESRNKPSKSTTKLVSLLPNCLSDDLHIASEVSLARTRVVMGLSASRVVTGQGRWGIWRDEAIWTCKWAAGLHQGVFLHTLLTGFLATHVDWLQALSSPAYRKRALLRKQNQNEDDLSLPARTIIVSEDKMAARRIIFLLSAFLPANQQVHGPRVHRPSTSGASVGAFSNSPPSYVVPVVREESLRRKINRRTGFGRTSHSRTASQSTRSVTLSSQMGHLNITADASNHQRRASDAASIRTPGLPIPGHDLMSRKSSVATSTIMQDSTTPHFSTIQRTDSLRRRRPGSSGSAAADDLKRSLKRGESGGGGAGGRPTSQGLRWSSIMSGLWNARRRESMDSGSTYSQASDLRSPIKVGFPQSNRLSDIGRGELAPHEEVPGRLPAHLRQASNARDVDATTRGHAERIRKSFTQADRTPDPNGAFESPIKTSINADDSVIDVDVPFPDYIASFESAISSPSSSGYLSTPGLPGLESFEQSGRISIDGDLPLNAAGWLNRFHPDFVLQGVPPQEDLVEEVKAALQAEPTPAVLQSGSDDVSERWVDISSALVVDTTTDSILRITYRRLVKPRPVVENVVGGVAITPSALPQDTMLDEKWVEELVTVPDDTLSEALEKIIHLVPDSSKEHSSASSQVHVDILGPLDTGSTMPPDTLSEVTQTPEPPLEIPRRQCKTVVLSALEDTIRDVIDRNDDDTPNNCGRKQQPPASENVLRLAVRQWANTLGSSE
ncbi:folliculin-interacting protein N-terminus domain-containing protein [Trichoderma austrokoningii]